MFKHLTRLARANQLSTQGLTTVHNSLQSVILKNNVRVPQKLRFFNQQFGAFSTQTATKQNTTANLESDFSNIIPDYNVNESDQTNFKKILLTKEDVYAKHPADYLTPSLRQHLDYASQIQKNEFLLFNLPITTTVDQIKELCSVKGVQVQRANVTKSLDEERLAFAYVEVGSPSQVKILREKFRNLWIQDRKIKLKGSEELSYETYNHRTLVVRNIPIHYKNKELIQMLGSFGAIVGIEMPTKNIAIEQELQEKMDSFNAEKKEKRDLDIRRAQKLVQDSLKENEEFYKSTLEKYLGSEEAERIMLSYLQDETTLDSGSATKKFADILDGYRQKSIQVILSQLQSENTEVIKAKKVLHQLRQSIDSQTTPALGLSSSLEPSELISNNKDIIKKAINYISENRQEIDDFTLSKLNEQILQKNIGETIDPIEKLQALSRSQLAFAYDILLEALSQREKAIEKRIKEQINHLGVEERILFEEKDWQKELEDIKTFDDPFNSEIKAEQILSVSEQVDNVMKVRNMTPEQKLYELVTKTYNPFIEANFNENQLMYAENVQLNEFRYPTEPPAINKAPSVNQMLFKGYTYFDDNLQYIQEKIESLRDKFDLPFDELYHKEKKLVDAVIKATQALKQKELSLPEVIGADRQFNLNELKNEYLGEEYQNEHRFISDQRKKSKIYFLQLKNIDEKLLNESIDDGGSSTFKFSINDTQSKIEQMLDQGVITKKEYDQFVQIQKEAQEVNLGYAFVTFSHSDEAKLALIVAQNLNAENLQIDLSIKNDDVDHKDFDFSYRINKQRNESKISNELKNLRESRKELRDFEQNIDKDLVNSIFHSYLIQPSLKKLKEFRELARDTIDNSSRHNLNSLVPRTKEEEENVNEKIRQLQRENPDIDYTQLFDTERAETARKAQHKKAFASYKAFQFLKHGVELQSRSANQEKKTEKKQPAPYATIDPYDFPPVQENVKRFMNTKDKLPRVIDAGDKLDNKPGRKFGYTENDFMEAYFGKDFARNALLELNEENPVFGFNDSLKKKYPIDKYQKLPQIEANRKLLREKSDLHPISLEAKDQDFQRFVQNIDIENAENRSYKDTPHPSDPNRSLIKDAQNRIENYLKRKEKQTGHHFFNTKEVAGIRRNLLDEYFPKPKKIEEAAAEDTKIEEKFEPYFEGEQNEQKQSHSQKKASGKHGSKQQKADYEKSPFFAGLAQKEFINEEPASSEQREATKDFLYDYKFRKRTLPKEQQEQEPVNIQRLEEFAEINKKKPEELFDQIKEWANLGENTNLTGGRLTRKEKLGLINNDYDVQGRQKKIKNLSDFAGKPSNNEEDLSEREDEDIYAHYMEQMRKSKIEQAKSSAKSNEEKLAQEQIKELENMFPEMPRFEGFFKSQSEGKHPFEEDQFKQHPQKSEEDIKAEEDYDEELLKRELEGRLIGETLTPLQFEVLYKAKVEHGQQIKFMKDQERKQFIDNRDMVRILDEQQEAARRRMVLNGIWTEEESKEKMRAETIKQKDKIPHFKDEYMTHRDFNELKEMFSQMQSPQKMYEKEYYFDEGLGESLIDHVESIKNKFPDLQVMVRRDRDGYAVVKTLYKPKYKYSLDDIQNFDVDLSMTKVKESLDDILKTVIGKDSLHSLDKQQLEEKLLAMKGNNNDQFDFDQKTKDAVAYLWKERVQGRFKDDREGFTKAFLELQENASFDEKKKLSGSALFNNGYEADPEKIFNEMNQERDLMTHELAEQMALRVKEHLFLKERKATDFVKPRRSELSIFSNQIQQQENAAQILNREASELEGKQNDEGFDKEAYQAIKAEIKKRREAKERLLQQGFPELKPYIHI